MVIDTLTERGGRKMRILRLLVGVLILLVLATSAMAAGKKKSVKRETTPCQRLFDTYITMLIKEKNGQNEMDKEYAVAEMSGDLYMHKMTSAVRVFTKQQLNYANTINSLKDMSLGPQFEEFRKNAIETLQHKNKLMKEATAIAKSVIKAPYGKATEKLKNDAARLPELTAQMEHLDETLFHISKGLAMYGYDFNNRDDENRMRLKLTRAERDNIISNLDSTFNFEDKDNMNWTTASAYVFRSLMDGEAKSFDE